MRGDTRCTHGGPHVVVVCHATPRSPYGWLRLPVACVATSRASLETYPSSWPLARTDHIHRATSCFPVHSPIFDLSDIFSIREQPKYLFYARSDELNIFNNSRLNSNLDGKYFSILRLPRKIFLDVKIGFSSNFGFPVVLTFRPAYFMSCF